MVQLPRPSEHCVYHYMAFCSHFMMIAYQEAHAPIVRRKLRIQSLVSWCLSTGNLFRDQPN